MSTTQAGARTTKLTRSDVEDEIERFRQLVIASRATVTVGPQAKKCVVRLNALHERAAGLFTAEDARWLNVLCGYLGQRLAAHEPAAEHTFRPKRKGDALDRCWRCETRVDERFAETCVACSDRQFQWMACPVCRACGCQRTGRTLV